VRPHAATAAARTTGRPSKPAKRARPAKSRQHAATSSGRSTRARAVRSQRPAPKRVARAQRSVPRRVARTAAPRIHRRVSGPARPRLAPVIRRRRAGPAPVRLARFVRTLPDRRLVCRLVAGQWWIVLIGFLLMGIVAMQVSLLKLNAGIGRDVERSASLQRRNGELRAEVSRLSAGERIQTQAGALGMVMPSAGAVSYVRAAGPRDARAAAAAIEQGRFAPGAAAMPLLQATPNQQTDPQAAQDPTAVTDPDAAIAGGTVAAAGTSP
jgi:hypothetical protein